MLPYLAEVLAGSTPAIPAVDVVAKATLVLAAAGAVVLALRHSSAASRHLAWCLGLGAALVLPALSLALPGWSCASCRPQRRPADRFHRRATPRTLVPAQPAKAPQSPGAIDLEEEMLESDRPAGRLPSRPTAANRNAALIRSWGIFTPSWSWIWAAWLIGAGTVMSAPIAGRIALRRWTREAEPVVGDDWASLLRDLSARLSLARPVILLRSNRATMPMTWGRTRPVILLPAESRSWEVERRRNVLLHELAHVRRHDCLTQMIAHAACAIYWFHPLVWIAERRMRIERERACDDIVLRAGARASDYARHLLEIARSLQVPRTAALASLTMARPSQLEGRLVAILDPARCRRVPARRVTAVALLAAALALVPLATFHLGATVNTVDAIPVTAPIADDPANVEGAARMTLTGHVLDPAGKPVPHAHVMIIARSKYASRPQLESGAMGAMTAHEGRCDGSGKFRIELPRTTSAQQHGLTLTATAPGNGCGWTDLDPDLDPPVADVSLRPELIVRGRVFDVKGQPAPGVTLRIESVIPVIRGRYPHRSSGPTSTRFTAAISPPGPGRHSATNRGDSPCGGLSRDLLCWLLVEDPRFAIPFTAIQTAEKIDTRQPVPLLSAIKVDPGPDPRPVTITVQPARTVVGRVTFADTGQPVPRALVFSGQRYFEAGVDGRFRIAEPPARTNRFGIRAQSPEGAPYLIATKQADWPPGAVEQSVDVALHRGVVVRGKITEEGTGRPVAGAVVRFTANEPPGGVPPSIGIPTATTPDGTYRVAAPPGPGYLVVQGPDDDYVLHEFGADGGIYVAQPGRRRFYAHAYRAVELKRDGPDHEVNLALRRGVAIHGLAVGPDGRPVQVAWVCSQLMLWTVADGGWKLWVAPQNHSRSQLRDGRFVLHGLDPGAAVEIPAFFLDPRRKLGATVRFSGRSAASGPVTVRLESCGTAKMRLVTADGKPLDRYPARTLISMVVTPGPLRGRSLTGNGPLLANEADVAQLDPVNYSFDLQSDAQGRLTFPALIPVQLIGSKTLHPPSAAASRSSARSSSSSLARRATSATSWSPGLAAGTNHESRSLRHPKDTRPTGAPTNSGRCSGNVGAGLWPGIPTRSASERMHRSLAGVSDWYRRLSAVQESVGTPQPKNPV